MKNMLFSLVILAVLLTAPDAPGQNRFPHVGYVYPAGGQVGSTVQVAVGGMNLDGINAGRVSGDAVKITSVRFFQPFPRLSLDARRELLPIMWAVANGRDPVRASKFFAKRTLNRLSRQKAEEENEVDAGDTPDIVPGERLIYLDMTPQQAAEKMKALSPLEFACLHKMLTTRPNSLQASPAIEQIAIAQIAIAADASPGLRELRLISLNGITNPLRFEIVSLPEVTEPPQYGRQPKISVQSVDLPCLINGQILPGEVDLFEFTAEKGQVYTFELLGRKLVPFLGDAVPGWFQPVLAVFDAEGKRTVAFADDNLFDPDPVLTFVADKSGKYQLQVRDSIYRGREDFVYRIKAYPGEPRQENEPAIHLIMPRQNEREPNNTRQMAEQVDLPTVVAGSISKEEDVDIYTFQGRKGMRVAAEVIGRRMNSPIDSLLRLTDSSGSVLDWNDDGNWLNVGIKTHHADSALCFELPADGTYFLHISDAQNKSGLENKYFLRISEAIPDFQVYMDPSALNGRSGDHVPVTLHVQRQDGFDGPIDLYVKEGPEGLYISGGRIPAGVNKARATLAIPSHLRVGTYSFCLQAAAGEEAAQIVHDVVPVDEIMQAFLWLHLVPATQSLIHVNRHNWTPFLPTDDKVLIQPGSTTTVTLKTARPMTKIMQHAELSFALNSPPAGITLAHSSIANSTVTILLKADQDMSDWQGNLIVDCFTTRAFKMKDGRTRSNTARLGSLPAITVRISK